MYLLRPLVDDVEDSTTTQMYVHVITILGKFHETDLFGLGENLDQLTGACVPCETLSPTLVLMETLVGGFMGGIYHY